MTDLSPPKPPEMAKAKKTEQKSEMVLLKTILTISFIVLCVSAAYKILGLGKIESNPRLTDLEKSLRDMRAAMNIDSVRQHKIQRIMRIISDHNPEMPSGMRYEIADEIHRMGILYTNLDVDLICAIITHESGGTWEPEVRSESGALGLMQVMPATALWIARYEGISWTSPEEVLFNPIYNIRIGCRQLSTYIEMYELKGGLAAYNGGEKRAAEWIKNGKAKGMLWVEINSYVPQIDRLYQEYKTIIP